ncbi:hypothetical protein EVG20_g1148 [Dentipellis fragilis]|uniref:Protein kinase domain-containing protein n=1 Tax=Dentipellis fragilis TaxID=205917 RepID=A0A4Y9ZB95_9AGAM|nr:hypothetical protein EVG20_g1148 [Dentipellis fragilis]
MSQSPLAPPQDATDIFSLSDQVLADRLQFIKEIGFGNWGSVWLCHPKSGRTKLPQEDIQVAVKLVHRSKTTTTAARVRSLWNEMKVVRAFKDDPHPSIVPFHSFIITPSYALITMDYLPDLIPVEVPEPKAKEWFRSLLSGVQFLHRRGVVHNDIKPANILLSRDRVPVLVDFGFAEKYEMKGSKAFHSNLTYGTPEYLSPERARGQPHDTRKSDVWSLGVTFFEILVGRTPFEYEEGEQFTTKADLEKYWARTVRGKWVGSYKMSKGAERLLRRMIQPNADLRCIAADAMADPYWEASATSSHHKSASLSFASSLPFSPSSSTANLSSTLSPSSSKPKDREGSKLIDIISPWSTRRLSKDALRERKTHKPSKSNVDKENVAVLTKTKKEKENAKETPVKGHARAQSQPRVLSPEEAPAAVHSALAPIRGSPPVTPSSAGRSAHLASADKEKENQKVIRRSPSARKPLPPVPAASGLGHAPRVPSKDITGKAPRKDGEKADAKEKDKDKKERKEAGRKQRTDDERGMGSVRDRMREWERERERLREMASMEEQEPEVASEKEEEEPEEKVLEKKEAVGVAEKKEDVKVEAARRAAEAEERERERPLKTVNAVQVLETPVVGVPATPISPDMRSPSLWGDSFPRSVSGNESGLSILRQSLKMSIDKTMQLYKSSIGQKARRPSQAPDATLDMDVSERQSWEDDELLQQANSSLPVVRQAMRNERVGADNRADRMSIWLQNVEKVVEDARQNFASSSVAQLPPLPLAPLSNRSSSQNRSNRSSRLPRKILAASQIFQKENEQPSIPASPPAVDPDRSLLSASTSMYAAANASAFLPNMTLATIPTLPSEEPSRATMILGSTPPRARRATVTIGRSPEKSRSLDIESGSGSPSKRKEKSRSQNDLLRPISPIANLQLELERLSQPSPPLRLSAVVDKSLFLAEPAAKPDLPAMPTTPLPAVQISSSNSTPVAGAVNDSLTASPFHVEPYPARAARLTESPVMDSPTRHRVEGIYDRFLMATSGVKRVGRGYQSDNVGPMGNTLAPSPTPTLAQSRSAPRMFGSTRRPMPPPVSSDDQRRTVSVDELGVMQSTASAGETPMSMSKEDRTNTVRNVRRAIRAIVTGKTVTK